MARRDALSAALAVTPKPAQSRAALARLSVAHDQLDVLTGLQVSGWGQQSVGMWG